MQSQLNISVDPRISTRFPHFRVSGIIAKRIHLDQSLDPLHQYSRTAVEWAKKNEEPAKEVIASWRDIYRTMGIKPSKFRCSFESLYRRVQKGYNPVGINALVDAYNVVSIRHFLCMQGAAFCQSGSIERVPQQLLI